MSPVSTTLNMCNLPGGAVARMLEVAICEHAPGAGLFH